MSKKKNRAAKCRLDDDGAPEVVAIEAGEDPQALWVRVGPVYDHATVERKKPGIWIQYQGNHMASDMQGPILLTPKVWQRLVQAVGDNLEGWES